jgi:hypothetical protein
MTTFRRLASLLPRRRRRRRIKFEHAAQFMREDLARHRRHLEEKRGDSREDGCGNFSCRLLCVTASAVVPYLARALQAEAGLPVRAAGMRALAHLVITEMRLRVGFP